MKKQKNRETGDTAKNDETLKRRNKETGEQRKEDGET